MVSVLKWFIYLLSISNMYVVPIYIFLIIYVSILIVKKKNNYEYCWLLPVHQLIRCDFRGNFIKYLLNTLYHILNYLSI